MGIEKGEAVIEFVRVVRGNGKEEGRREKGIFSCQMKFVLMQQKVISYDFGLILDRLLNPYRVLF